jgi:hypothetical protein
MTFETGLSGFEINNTEKSKGQDENHENNYSVSPFTFPATFIAAIEKEI